MKLNTKQSLQIWQINSLDLNTMAYYTEQFGYDFNNFEIFTNQFIENEFGDREKRTHNYRANNQEKFFKMIETFKNNIV